MPLYEYGGLNEAGATIQDSIAAPSIEIASLSLEESGLTLFYIGRKREGMLKGDLLGSLKGVSMAAVVQFSRKLSTMIGAGVTPIKAIEALHSQEKSPKFQAALLAINADIQAGLELHEAFAKHPTIFDSFYVALIRAGEASGQLEETLSSLAEKMEKKMRIRRAVRSATVYPKVVLGLAFLIVSGILLFIIPRFVKIFIDTAKSFESPGHPLDASLPKPTQYALNASHLLYPVGAKDMLWFGQVALRFAFVFGCWFALRLAVRRAKRNPKFAASWDHVKIRVPGGIGDLIQMIAMADLTRTLATLLKAGIQIDVALELASKTSGNALVAEAVMKGREEILHGGTIARSLAVSPIFPPMVTSMIETGENTGKLEELLGKIADYYEEEVEMKIKGITSLIEPLLIVLIGAVVGSLVLITYLPMFKIYTMLQKVGVSG